MVLSVEPVRIFSPERVLLNKREGQANEILAT
jgi:hypothetical protein